MTEILVGTGVKGKLKEMFRVSSPTVRFALRGETSTLLAQKIRGAALKMGGVEKKQIKPE